MNFLEDREKLSTKSQYDLLIADWWNLNFSVKLLKKKCRTFYDDFFMLLSKMKTEWI